MKAFKLLPIMVLVACSGPSKQDAAKVFAAATTSMASAQTQAVTSTRNGNLSAPAQLSLTYNGACALGGTVAVNGNYDGTGTGQNATFDLSTTFAGCRTLTSTLDGNLTWTSVASSGEFSASMTGSLDYADSNTTASCDFDLHLAVSAVRVTYTGTVCGYDVQTDLRI